MKPIVTLTTDLGGRDFYLSTIKAKLLSQDVDCHIIDISHEIDKFNIAEAAFVLKNVMTDFPKGTIHIIGVGSGATDEGRHLGIQYKGQYILTADNGFFSLIADHHPDLIVDLQMNLDTDAPNFPTRDLYVPAALHLARGGTLEVIGRRTEQYAQRTLIQPVKGEDYLKGMEDGLGDKKGMIVAKASYETTDPTVSNQMVTLKSSGADTFFNVTTPKWAAQAIKIAAELGWKPTHYLNSVSSSVGSVMVPAGAENGIGIISSNYFKDPADPVWANDKGFLEYKAWLEKNMPGANIVEGFYVSGYIHAAATAQVIRQAGDDLTRANIMKQAANLKNFENGMLLPGIKLNTSATDFYPVENKQLMKWNGKSWEMFGEIYGPK